MLNIGILKTNDGPLFINGGDLYLNFYTTHVRAWLFKIDLMRTSVCVHVCVCVCVCVCVVLCVCVKATNN